MYTSTASKQFKRPLKRTKYENTLNIIYLLYLRVVDMINNLVCCSTVIFIVIHLFDPLFSLCCHTLVPLERTGLGYTP